MNRIWLLANIHFNDGLLDYFLRYYRQKGITDFGLIWHLPTVPDSLLGQPDIHLVHNEEPYISGPRDNDLLNAFRVERLQDGDWYVPADLDEFHWCDGLVSFAALVSPSYDYLKAAFVDRLSRDGRITPIDPSLTLDEQFPLASRVTYELCARGCIDKVAFLRAHVPTNSGHHFAASGTCGPIVLETHHFKWKGDMWWWIHHREKLRDDVSAKEAAPFTLHYQIHGRINVFDRNLTIYNAPKIGI